MTRKQRRLVLIGGSLAVLAVAAALVLNALRDSIVFFSTPSMVAEKHISRRKAVPPRRAGAAGFAGARRQSRGEFQRRRRQRDAAGFLQGDPARSVPRRAGRRRRGRARCIPASSSADTVLAKHDETYMPKEVADALKKQGHWKDDYGAKPSASAAPSATQGAMR